MSRLPSALQPAWPLFKRLHRFATLVIGFAVRKTSGLFGERALPRHATVTSAQTAALEPGSVTIHHSGESEHVRRAMPQGYPAGHFTFAEARDYDVPQRFTLEIVDGIVVGDYGANLTPGRTLDYETSGYFGIKSWREHPIFLRSRLPEIEHVDGAVLSLGTRGGSVNYYHFLLDVLPRWGIFQETMPGRVPDALYVPSATGYQKQLLAMAGLDNLPIIETQKHRALQPDRLLVPCMPNPDEVAPRWMVDWVRQQFPPKDVQDKPRRIYVTRSGGRNTRRLVDEATIWPLLEQQGFVRIDPGTLSVQEQIDYFAAADTIVALHGAALTNLVFAQAGVRILELFAPSYVKMCFWAISENIPDAHYRYLVADDAGAQKAGKPMQGIQTDIDIDAATVMSAVDRLLE